ncbi:hypothetical protein QOT17_019340 [Balamuthia mandrillaris]
MSEADAYDFYGEGSSTDDSGTPRSFQLSDPLLSCNSSPDLHFDPLLLPQSEDDDEDAYDEDQAEYEEDHEDPLTTSFQKESQGLVVESSHGSSSKKMKKKTGKPGLRRTNSASAASNMKITKKSTSQPVGGSPRIPPRTAREHSSASALPSQQRKSSAPPSGIHVTPPSPPVASASSSLATEKEEGERTARRMERRMQVIKELVATEEKYVNSIEALVEVYLQDLRGSRLLEAEEVEIMFSNIEHILKLNQNLHTKLKERTTGWETQGTDPSKRVLSDILLSVFPFMKIYSQYCTRQDKATELRLKLVKENSKFKSFLKKAQQNKRCNNQDLGSFLIMPIQRIPRYKLLLQELLKCTPEEHADHKGLVKAFEIMDSIATFIEDRQQNGQPLNVRRLIAAHEQFGEVERMMQPWRKWVKDGEIMAVDRLRAANKTRQLWIFLFTDILCFARLKSRGGSLAVSPRGEESDSRSPPKSPKSPKSPHHHSPSPRSKNKLLANLDIIDRGEKEKAGEKGGKKKKGLSPAASLSSLSDVVGGERGEDGGNEEETDEEFEFLGKMYLSEVWLRDVDAGSGGGNTFLLYSPQVSFIFTAGTAEEKKVWMDTLASTTETYLDSNTKFSDHRAEVLKGLQEKLKKTNEAQQSQQPMHDAKTEITTQSLGMGIYLEEGNDEDVLHDNMSRIFGPNFFQLPPGQKVGMSANNKKEEGDSNNSSTTYNNTNNKKESKKKRGSLGRKNKTVNDLRKAMEGAEGSQHPRRHSSYGKQQRVLQEGYLLVSRSSGGSSNNTLTRRTMTITLKKNAGQHRWRKRYCVLLHDRLMLYKSKEDTKMSGCVILKNCKLSKKCGKEIFPPGSPSLSAAASSSSSVSEIAEVNQAKELFCFTVKEVDDVSTSFLEEKDREIQQTASNSGRMHRDRISPPPSPSTSSSLSVSVTGEKKERPPKRRVFAAESKELMEEWMIKVGTQIRTMRTQQEQLLMLVEQQLRAQAAFKQQQQQPMPKSPKSPKHNKGEDTLARDGSQSPRGSTSPSLFRRKTLATLPRIGRSNSSKSDIIKPG